MAPSAVDFTFVSDPEVRTLLEEYFDQALRTFNAEAYVGTLALSRAVLEGLLTWRLELVGNEAREKYRELAPKKNWRPKTPSAVQEWKLDRLIDVAVALGLVGDHPEEAHALRKYGNLIHPYRARRNSWAPPDGRLAQNAMNYVSLFADSVHRRLQAAAASVREVSWPTKTLDDLNFRWVLEGKLAGCAGPESGNDLLLLHRHGIRALVRLAHPDDTDGVGVTTQEVEQAGLDDCPEPVPDGTAPEPDQIDKILAFVAENVEANRPVAVSCGAGCGRTGTILACWLVKKKGMSAQEAIKAVKTIEEPEQRTAVRNLEARLRSQLS